MEIQTRQDLVDYALRQLGGGVVNIEVTTDQLEDAVTDAIQYYQEYHFDGIERDYIKYQITPTLLTVADSTGFAIGDLVTTSQGSSAYVVGVAGNVIQTNKNLTGIFKSTQTLTNGTATSVINSVKLGALDLGYIDIPDNVFSILRVVNTTGILNSPDILFNIQYQIISNEIRNITAGSANYLYSTMNYLGHLDFILRKEKSFRFNRRMNRVFFDESWELAIGNWYVFEVYFTLDPEIYNEVYNDRWLKRYVTAKIKRLWGTNLKKYSGMTLPGGINYSGQQTYDEAMQELAELELEASGSGAPLMFAMG